MDILKTCMYLSEGQNCNFDEITAVSYLETFFVLAVMGYFLFFFKLSA